MSLLVGNKKRGFILNIFRLIVFKVFSHVKNNLPNGGNEYVLGVFLHRLCLRLTAVLCLAAEASPPRLSADSHGTHYNNKIRKIERRRVWSLNKSDLKRPKRTWSIVQHESCFASLLQKNIKYNKFLIFHLVS